MTVFMLLVNMVLLFIQMMKGDNWTQSDEVHLQKHLTDIVVFQKINVGPQVMMLQYCIQMILEKLG